MNVTYAIRTEHMTAKQITQFDRELKADPGRRGSSGTSDLMRAFGMAT